MKYIVKLNNKSYEVEVEKGEAILLSTVELAPQAAAPIVAAPVAPMAAAAAPAPAPQATSAGGTQVASPMPGTIVAVKVAMGQKVSEGDVLFILEAMKMENEITAPCSGTIAQLAVQKGAAVDTAALLAVIS